MQRRFRSHFACYHVRKADDRSCRSRTSACPFHTTAVDYTAAAEESPVVTLAARVAELEAVGFAAAAVERLV